MYMEQVCGNIFKDLKLGNFTTFRFDKKPLLITFNQLHKDLLNTCV